MQVLTSQNRIPATLRVMTIVMSDIFDFPLADGVPLVFHGANPTASAHYKCRGPAAALDLIGLS
jgi:hypothetical protein